MFGGFNIDNQFFSLIFRMKYINRWALMRNTSTENIAEHSLDVAIIAHALGVLKNKRFGGNLNCEHLAVLAMYHDCTEIITGDMPTPIKYYNKDIKQAYKQIEAKAADTLLTFLPDDINEEYSYILKTRDDDEYLWRLVKAADRISAYIKCIEERKMGNSEFLSAENSILTSINQINLPEVSCFMQEFIPAFTCNIDEQA